LDHVCQNLRVRRQTFTCTVRAVDGQPPCADQWLPCRFDPLSTRQVQPPTCCCVASCMEVLQCSVLYDRADKRLPPLPWSHALVNHAWSLPLFKTVFIRTCSYTALARTCRLQRVKSTCCNTVQFEIPGERPPPRSTEVWRRAGHVGGTAFSAGHRTPLSQARAPSLCRSM